MIIKPKIRTKTKIKMKRVLLLLLALIIAVSLAACGEKDNENSDGGGSNSDGGGSNSGGKGSAAAEDFIKVFASGNFYMRVDMQDEDIPGPFDLYLYNGMMAMYMEIEDAGAVRMIYRDDKTYMIFESLQMYQVIDGIDDSLDLDFDVDGDSVFLKSGKEEFNGKTLNYDEYADEGESESSLRIFLDGGKVAGIRTLEKNGDVEQDIIIYDFQAIDDGIAFTVFDYIPSDYELIE